MQCFKIIFSLLAVFLCTTGIRSQTLRPMANTGDTVWVYVNHVKADKKDQFEKFVYEIFWPMGKNLSDQDQKIFNQTRILYPVKPERDGTYSYLFIMDPVISGGDYDIESLLKKMYDEQKAKVFAQMFEETLAGDQTGYMLVQSKY